MFTTEASIVFYNEGAAIVLCGLFKMTAYELKGELKANFWKILYQHLPDLNYFGNHN